MKNIKITYVWTKKEDLGMPNNNYNEEAEHIIVEPPFDFGDWLQNNNVNFEHEKESETYYVLNEYEERTGEAYKIIKEEETENN